MRVKARGVSWRRCLWLGRRLWLLWSDALPAGRAKGANERIGLDEARNGNILSRSLALVSSHLGSLGLGRLGLCRLCFFTLGRLARLGFFTLASLASRRTGRTTSRRARAALFTKETLVAAVGGNVVSFLRKEKGHRERWLVRFSAPLISAPAIHATKHVPLPLRRLRHPLDA